MKRLTAMFLTLLLLLSLSACGTASQNQTDNTDSGNSQTEEPTVTDDGTETESGFPFTLTTKDGAEVTLYPCAGAGHRGQRQCGRPADGFGPWGQNHRHSLYQLRY